MPLPPSRRAILLPCFFLALSCAQSPAQKATDLLPALQRGTWSPATGVVELDLTGRRSKDASWEPYRFVARTGWERASSRGWSPTGASASMAVRSGPGTDLYVQLRKRSTQAGSVEVLADGEIVGRVDLEQRTAGARFHLPSSPAELVLRSTAPLVAFTVKRLGFLEPTQRLSRPHQKPGLPFFDSAESTLVLPGPGTWTVAMRLPDSAASMRFDVRFASPGTLVATATDLMGERFPLGEVGSGQAVFDVRPLAGRQVFLSLTTDARIEIRSPEIALEATQEVAEAPSPLSSSRPDVLVVILDAARGDRFLGYPRPVIPEISSIFDESLVFSRAFSECPNTACSIPTLITGVSFQSFGTVFKGKRLPDEVTTLAEYLQPLGYRAVGLAASPNHSVAQNFHQGMDLFRRTWGKGNPYHGPFGMSRLAARIIGEQPADEPLFLQLHYRPPHQPYDPRPEFDLFTDPDYEGLVRPRMSLEPFSRGHRPLSRADLEELVGSYDGNLLMVDAAVGQVFETLRSAGRWDNTLVVITADHGEAFFEHGYLTHNATVFDEMLHVPLVVRLPGGKVPADVDTTRLASLGDIVPTILGRIGVRPVPEVEGIDLLTDPADPVNPRVLFHRTNSDSRRQYAARTPRWKAISRAGVQDQGLFDLAADPGETNNLVTERPWLFAGLGQLLQAHLERGRGGAAGEDVELTEEAIQQLEALGYLD